MQELLVTGSDLIIMAIVVLWTGDQITRKVPLLQRHSIPIAVTGGVLCSGLLVLLAMVGGPKITFDMTIRDTLLMVFFTTIGISAKFSQLKYGGAALGILVLCAGVFLVIQDITGVLMAKAFGVHPAYGLFAGSVSLAGGHGTAIAWGTEAAAAGLLQAEAVGIAFATFGLVAGGIIGGPVAEYLIKRNSLDRSALPAGPSTVHRKSDGNQPSSLRRVLGVLFVLAICLSFGEVVNRWLFANDIKLPGFLTAMMVGIALTNLADFRKKPLPAAAYQKTGEIALQLFLAMSLMSMDWTSVSNSFGKIFLVVGVQTVVITLFGVFVLFRVMGADYDAAVIAGGFCGLGMGATPVAIANMNAITEKHGPSYKALLVIPLVGAFFVDLLNALVIKLFIALPWIQPG